MASLTALRIPAQTRTYSIDPPGTCRVCGAPVPAVVVEVAGIATPGEREGNVVPLDVRMTTAVVTATGCGHVLNINENQAATKESR